MTFRRFPRRFGAKAGILLKSEIDSFRKCHLILMRRDKILQNLSLIPVHLFSFEQEQILNLFQEFLYQNQAESLWLKLKIVSEQKCPFKRLPLVISVIIFPETSVLFCNSSRIFTSSSSCVERKSRSNMFSEIFDVFQDVELLVALTGGDVCILEELSFSS